METRAILDNLPLAILATVGVEQICGYLNRTFIQTLGYTLDDLSSVADWWQLAYPDEAYRSEVSAEWNQRVMKAFATQLPIEPMESAVVCRDGSQKDFSWGCVPIGEIALTYGHDLTDRKRAGKAEARLEELAWQARQADDLKRLAGTITHHFSNQLQAVLGNLEVAQERAANGEDVHDLLASAMCATRQAAEVGDLIRTYLGESVGERKPLDLSEVCRQCLTNRELAIPEGIVLGVDTQPAGPIVDGSATQLRQVLERLIANACEATNRSEAHIRVSVRTLPASDLAAMRLHPDGFERRHDRYACIEVADDGCGINEKDIGELFDPSSTTKSVGRGMGLPIVLGITRAHGGAIQVSGGSAKGTAVRVLLPVHEAGCSIAEPPNPEHGGDGDPGVVLVVEDHAPIRHLAVLLFRHLGLDALQAKDGVEALEVFRQRPDEIGLVFCDVAMPRLDGWGTLRALRQLSPRLRFVLTSGYSEAEVMSQRQSDRPDCFLQKPYSKEEIRNMLLRLWPSALKTLPGSSR